MVVIGIVGRSGAGKSTVARVFASFGAEVLDVDQVARRVVEPGSQVLTRIGEEFGSEYLRDDGRLDRRRLGRLVFSDPEQLLKLNRITHPVIKGEVEKWLDGVKARRLQPPAAVLDAAVLFEAGLRPLVDRVVLVVAGEEESVKRLVARDGIGHDEARTRLMAQKDPRKLAALADFVIDAGGTMDELIAQVRRVWDKVVGSAE